MTVCPGVQAAFKDGNEIEVDFGAGSAKNLTVGKYLKAEPLPPNLQHILMCGGLVEVTKAKLDKRTSGFGLSPNTGRSKLPRFDSLLRRSEYSIQNCATHFYSRLRLRPAR